MQYKQSIRDLLRPEGFYGFKLEELTPTKTRRAQVTDNTACTRARSALAGC
jgi:hypothetical protein